ncbi:MAG: hypothetical protein WCT85_03050 [Parachlamydiales bacterium]|jgi:hypothetical protein
MTVQANNIIIPDTTKDVGLNVLISGLNDVIIKEATLMVLYSDAMRQSTKLMNDANIKQKKVNEELYSKKPLYELPKWLDQPFLGSVLNTPNDVFQHPEKMQSTLLLFAGLACLSTTFSGAYAEKIQGMGMSIAQKGYLYSNILSYGIGSYYALKKGRLTSESQKLQGAIDSLMNNTKCYQEGYDNLSKTDSSSAKAIQEIIQNDYRSKRKS